ncbi:MAG: Bifunctional protein FolD [Candidatus Kaiserbacteria bacterium GW2011_GWC2_52_8b]|uniref:Bifunctional protein FolD n=2 Tax=Candidatus Kaiseribacteriota TaxID=1752734 RepID=A0A0G1XHW2_9BACT|nr:MAG: Bifunctional protein FolD [Candidatus Kaiserbacteria bacterium GW2011_GWA2_52_12]KKW30551.1 MAG: Bifunctional protein FolD [Candidatus Kaiserbacteria bacterium GW2011_GWC2_52_8b]
MIIDGRALAESVYAELVAARAQIPRAIKLGVLTASHDPAIESFVRIKTRAAAKLTIDMVRVETSEGVQTSELLGEVERLAARTDGIIVQLPLPSHIDCDRILRGIPSGKDVDVLSPEAFGMFKAGGVIVPPVAAAIVLILEHSTVKISGARAVVVGEGRLVGKPAAIILKQRGASVISLKGGQDVASYTRDADIIVLGAGSSGILKPEMVKLGAVVIDAGTSELGGKLVGDADPLVAEKCTLFTPVPGGVGPVAVAMIFRNLFALIGK